MSYYELTAFFGTYRYQVTFCCADKQAATLIGKDFEKFINKDVSPANAGLRTRVNVCLLEIAGYDFGQHKFKTQPTTIIWDSKG